MKLLIQAAIEIKPCYQTVPQETVLADVFTRGVNSPTVGVTLGIHSWTGVRRDIGLDASPTPLEGLIEVWMQLRSPRNVFALKPVIFLNPNSERYDYIYI